MKSIVVLLVGLTVVLLALFPNDEAALDRKDTSSPRSVVQAKPGQEVRFGVKCERTNVGWVQYRQVCTWTKSIIQDTSGTLREVDGGGEDVVDGRRYDAIAVLASIVLMLGAMACFHSSAILAAFVLGSFSALATTWATCLTAAQVFVFGRGIMALAFSLVAVWVAMGALHTVARNNPQVFYFIVKVHTISMVIVYSLL